MGGGQSNYIYSYNSHNSIVGGCTNNINTRGSGHFIGGGICNNIVSSYAGYQTDNRSFIGGGCKNIINGYTCCNFGCFNDNVLVGGCRNKICGFDLGTKVSGSSNFIGSGQLNTASGNFNFIGSGCKNVLKASNTEIVGGFSNTASGNFTSIVGGFKNTASANFSSIVGGTRNNFEGGNDGYGCSISHKFIGGGCLNQIGFNSRGSAYQSGKFSSIVGGQENKICQCWAFIGGGCKNIINGYGNTKSVIVGGNQNTVNAYSSHVFIGGGSQNYASSANTVIVGGVCNSNSSCYGFIGAGRQNSISGYEGADSIVGGKYNRIVGTYGVNNQQNFIGGGCRNCINGLKTSIVGGVFNTASSSNCSFIGGGYCNTLFNSKGSSIVGGGNNIISGSTIAPLSDFNVIGGSSNTISGSFTAVFGLSNTASRHCANFIAGEGNSINSVSSYYGTTTPNHSTIAGGCGNTLTDSSGFIGGGACNTISGYYTGAGNVIGGGSCNCIDSAYSSILGGMYNTASGQRTVIGGGCKNYISKFDNHAAILGGRHNCIDLNAIAGGVSNDIFLIGSYLTASDSGAVCQKIAYMNNTVVTGSLTVGSQDAINATVGRIDATNDIVAFSTSDRRLKCNIHPIDNALCKVIGVTGNTFDWKELTEEERKTIHGNTGRDVGVIAQEIESILPEAVTTRDSGYKAVNYEKIVPLLIEAIKEQQKQIDELKSRL